MLFYVLLLVSLINCNGIRNKYVHKSVDLRNQVAVFTEKIVVINTGEEPVEKYTYVIDPSIERVRMEFNQESVRVDNRTYSIKLSKPILPSGRFTFNIVGVVLDELPIIPARTTHRFIHYKDNIHYYSVYETDMYVVTYDLLAKGELIETVPKIPGNNTRLHNNVRAIKSYSYSPLYVTYVNNAPFYLVTNLERKIDISHFGFIMVEDKVAVMNKGPRSKELYTPMPGHSRTKLLTILPELAFNIKLFDEIGNNSKSQLYYTDYDIILTFETRYELLMSWKTVYIIQYTVPAYPYLWRVNDTYVLKMPLVDDVLPGAFIQNAKIMVLLPEDSNQVTVNVTEDYVMLGNSEILATALAPTRNAVVFNSIDLVNGFMPNLRITYNRDPIRVFKPVLYIITYIESVFLCYLFVSYSKPMLALKKC